MKLKDTLITNEALTKKLKDNNAYNSNIVLIQAGPHSCVYNEDTTKFITFVPKVLGKRLEDNGIKWTTKASLDNKKLVLRKIHALRRR